MNFDEHFFNPMNKKRILWTYKFCKKRKKENEQIFNLINTFWNRWTNFKFGEQILKLMNNFCIWWTFFQFYEQILNFDEHCFNLMNKRGILWTFFESLSIFTHCDYFLNLIQKMFTNLERKEKKKAKKGNRKEKIKKKKKKGS